MINNNDLREYFWVFDNLITTRNGVELALHGDDFVEVSVLLRNEIDLPEEDAMMMQLYTSFDTLEDFMRIFSVKELHALKEIRMKDLMELYRRGMAELRHVDEERYGNAD